MFLGPSIAGFDSKVSDITRPDTRSNRTAKLTLISVSQFWASPHTPAQKRAHSQTGVSTRGFSPHTQHARNTRTPRSPYLSIDHTHTITALSFSNNGVHLGWHRHDRQALRPQAGDLAVGARPRRQLRCFAECSAAPRLLWRHAATTKALQCRCCLATKYFATTQAISEWHSCMQWSSDL